MKGDVLLIDFPFGHGGGLKVRPALSVQGSAVQSVNTIIAQITSNLGRIGQPTRFLINIADETESGLLSDSIVMCDNLYTVHNTRIIRSLGSLSAAAMAQIDRCLKAARGIP
jgi:mRNA-degrading endonuclease toxin of MazEF toxin-antitoxin module